ncbi:MAG: hypothetical protein ACFE9L_11765 [Candidatus Hodarchaeota archaeon]
MKKHSLLPLLILIPFFILLPITHPVKATWVHYYRYLDDAASYDSDIEEGSNGDAEVRDGDMDDLGMYASTGGLLSTAKAIQYIDGGRYNNSPWTFGTRTYHIKVYWKISGTYEEAGNNYFKFEYFLYYMNGSTRISVRDWTTEYTADFNYDEQLVNHYGGTVSLSSGKIYYLNCTITLYHYDWWSSPTSDMYYGANKLDFEYADFYWWFPGGP